MAFKQCEQCSEMVDVVKAFCPGCGFAFVAEKPRAELSDFDAMGNTVQLGQTMYNQMLTDMGLNISKVHDAAALQVEAVSASVPPQATPPAKASGKGINKWLIIAIVALVLLFLAVLVIIAAAVIILYLPM